MPYKNKEDQKAWRESHKDYMKAYSEIYRKTYKETEDQLIARRLKLVAKFYNLSPEDYMNMIEQQQNKCFICNREEHIKSKKGVLRPLCVDHDHVTGKVRGLLCNHCNSMLGHARDSIEILEKGIAYLQKHKGQ